MTKHIVTKVPSIQRTEKHGYVPPKPFVAISTPNTPQKGDKGLAAPKAPIQKPSAPQPQPKK